jgi:hypothetical protein
MYEVVRRVHAGESPIERCFVQTIALDDLGRLSPCYDLFRPPGQTPDGTAALFERSKKATADVPRSRQ